MSERITYDIRPKGETWLLSLRGGGRDDSSHFPTKEAAVEEGTRLGEAHDHAELVIRNAEGRIEEERKLGVADPRKLPGND
jgi:hypothetical protein